MYLNEFLVWHKKFEPAQNILGPVKGQGIRNDAESLISDTQVFWILLDGNLSRCEFDAD